MPVKIGLREEDVAGVLSLADGAQTSHGGLQHEHLGLWFTKQPHAKQRTAIPAFPPLVDQQDELLLRAFSIQPVELTDVVVGGDFAIAYINQNPRCGNAVLEQRTLNRRF